LSEISAQPYYKSRKEAAAAAAEILKNSGVGDFA